MTSEPDWLANINRDELAAVASDDPGALGLARIMFSNATLVTNAERTEGQKSTETDSRPYEHVWREIYLLACTNDPKYRTVRRVMSKEMSTVLIATGIAKSISKMIDFTVSVPVTAAVLLVFIEVSKNAACATLTARYGTKKKKPVSKRATKKRKP